MSSECVGWAFRSSPYSGSVLLVHLAVADIANDVHDYELWALTKNIAAKARVSPGSTRRALLQMVADGYLELIEDRSSVNQASRYRFLMPEGGRAPRATSSDEGRAPRATRSRTTRDLSRTTRDQVAHHARHRELEGEREDQREAEREPDALFVLDAEQRPADRIERFDVFWKRYPRRVGKTAAAKAWERSTRTVDPDTILAGVERYRDECEQLRTEPRFIAHPATWLNQGRWDDDPLPSVPPPRSAGMITDRDGPSRELTDAEIWGDDL